MKKIVFISHKVGVSSNEDIKFIQDSLGKDYLVIIALELDKTLEVYEV